MLLIVEEDFVQMLSKWINEFTISEESILNNVAEKSLDGFVISPELHSLLSSSIIKRIKAFLELNKLTKDILVHTDESIKVS